MAAAPMHFTPVAAIDPIALFVLFVIIVNVISGLVRGAHRRQVTMQQSSTTLKQVSNADAMQKAAELAAARAAQRARLQQAIQAAQQKMQSVEAAAAPPIIAAATAVAQAAIQQATRVPTAAIQAGALPSFDYGADLTSGLMQLTDLGSAAPAAAVPSTTLPILNDRIAIPDLVVASAIFGPPASARPPGHTPGGW